MRESRILAIAISLAYTSRDKMEEKILDFIQKKILHRRRKVGLQDSLFGAGVLDSVGHLQLITYLEKEFSVSFSLAEFTWENFDTVENIANMVRGKRGDNLATGKRSAAAPK